MTLIASHRGGALEQPENSPTAFRHTAALPVDQVEFDIHPTADGEIVVIHDATLERTTNGTGPVAARTLADLQTLTLKGTAADRIMTLAELAALFVPTTIMLRMEVKPDASHRPYRGLLRQALTVLDAANLRARTVVTSFQAETAAEAAAEPGLAGAIWLVEPRVQNDLGTAGIAAVAAANGVRAVGLRHNGLDAAVLSRLRSSGLAVGAWAVNDEAAIRTVLALGVDVFTTDIPTCALALRGQGSPR
jgi:glycerophosphoryl diester phosphodiesterase